ncbi:hypothetical protein ACVOMV_06930 [Mesorhizobium atlanticum]
MRNEVQSFCAAVASYFLLYVTLGGPEKRRHKNMSSVAVTPESRAGRRARARRIGLMLAAALAAIWAGIKINEFFEFERELTAYQDVRVQDSMAEIKYALGYPPYVLGPAEHQPDLNWGELLLEHQTDGKDPKTQCLPGRKLKILTTGNTPNPIDAWI